MKVTFRFETILRRIINEKEEENEFVRTVTIEEALKQISDIYEKISRGHIYTDILVNGRIITTLQGLKTKLKYGDEVTFLPLVGGG